MEQKMDNYTYQIAVESAKTHPIISQYTNLEALKKIIENKTLRLTRIDKLNDHVENSKIHPLWAKKVYVACFTHREHESYFFWNTYCKNKSYGVMISFPTDFLQNLPVHPDEKCQEAPLEFIKRTVPNVAFSKDVSRNTWAVFDYSCVDISYIPRNITLEKSEFQNESSNFQGRLKYVEWDMENETRLRVSIRPKCREVSSMVNEQSYYKPDNGYLYVKLSTECLESMTITLSPYSNSSLEKEVEQLLIDNNLYGRVKINKSILMEDLNE